MTESTDGIRPPGRDRSPGWRVRLRLIGWLPALVLATGASVLAQGPPNEECADAQVVAIGSLTPGTTAGATVNAEAPECLDDDIDQPSVWYEVVGDSRFLTATTCPGGIDSAAFDTKLTVFNRGCDTLGCVGNNDDSNGCSDDGSEVTWCGQPGESYIVAVHAFSGAGDFELGIEPGGMCLANDDCDDAVAIPIGGSAQGTTRGRAFDPEAIQCPDETGELDSIDVPGVWHTVVGNGNRLTATTCGPGNQTDYDSQLTVYCEDCPDLGCVARNDDSPDCPGFEASVTWCSEPGTTYRIFVYGAGEVGDYSLDIVDSGEACNDFVCEQVDQPPTCVLPDLTFPCEEPQTVFQADGTGSFDAESGLTYLWSLNNLFCPGVSLDDPTSPMPTVTFNTTFINAAGEVQGLCTSGLNQCDLSLTVTDAAGLQDGCSERIVLPAWEGACCAPDGGCSIQTRFRCEFQMGGTWQGPFTECEASTCISEDCGNGVPDGDEECDDGNNDDDDGCSAACVIEFCGDGIVHPGEACDEGDGNSNLPDATCREDCSQPGCGDGVVDSGEDCDDGPNNSDADPDACRTDCTNPVCGDGVTDSGEACDDGPNNSDADPDACRTDCTNPVCGDGVTDSGESCDDGPSNSDTDPDACRTDCTNPVCGDGVTDSGEDCDDGPNNSDTDPDACRTDCTNPVCGDGVTDSGEDCDDGGQRDGDGCEADCTFPATCGDGVIDPGEECDDGVDNSDAPGACRPDCTNPACGDGIVDPSEDCDDGNTADGDCCASDCAFEPVGSACEDGAFCTEGDTCDGAGACEAGPPRDCGDDDVCTDDSCDEQAGVCVNDFDVTNDDSCGPTCGNGIPEAGEECDDGNNDDGDDCANDCTVNASGLNLVANPFFREGKDFWRFFTNGQGSFQVVNEQAKVTSAREGSNVQLYQRGILLRGSTGYRLSFDAANTFGDDMWVAIQTMNPPFKNLGLRRRVPLTSAMRSFEYEFHTNPGDLPPSRLQFLFGPFDRDGTMYIIDNVRIAPLSSGCGNGSLELDEECDDGNNVSGDGCQADCLLPRCGDGFTDAPDEECDDGNTTDGDGCDASCRVETLICGDRVVDPGEECDDGNRIAGDGCDPECKIEPPGCDDPACGEGDRLIVNGDFSEGKAPWRFFANAAADFRVIGGVARLSLQEKGSNIQLLQREIRVKPGTRYRLHFRGRGSGGEDVRVALFSDRQPSHNYGLRRVFDLRRDFDTFGVTFTTPLDAAPDARLMFFVAPFGEPGTIYEFDDIVLEER